MNVLTKVALAAAAVVSSLAGTSAYGQNVIPAQNSSFDSGIWVQPGGNAAGTMDATGTGWAVSASGESTGTAVQRTVPTFPTNDGWVFSDQTQTDADASGGLSGADFRSTDSALGGYVGSGGDNYAVSWTGTNTLGRTAGYWKVRWDAEVGIVRLDAKRSRLVGSVNLGGTTFAAGNSKFFANTTAVAAGDIDVGASATYVSQNYAVPSNTFADRGIQSAAGDANGVLARVVAPDAPLSLSFSKVANDPTNGFARNIGIGVDNVKFVAVAAGDLNADFTVTRQEAFDTINSIGATGVNYTGGDADGDQAVTRLEAFDAVNNIGGAYASFGAPDAGLGAILNQGAPAAATASTATRLAAVGPAAGTSITDGPVNRSSNPGATNDTRATVVVGIDGSLTIEDVGGAGIRSLELTLELDTDRNPSTSPGAIYSFDPSKNTAPGAGTFTLADDSKAFSFSNLDANVASDGTVIGSPGYLLSTAGVPVADIIANMTVRYGRFGVPGTQVGDVVFIPEPGSLSLAGLAAAGLLARRQRRREG